MGEGEQIALALDDLNEARGLIRKRFVGEAGAALAAADRGWYERDDSGRWTAVGLPKGGWRSVFRATSVAVVVLLIVAALVLIAWLRRFDRDLY
jgi:hypothetical protein